MSSLTYDLTLAGLAVGSAAALTGIGLIVTYRATGVLNLAHGANAMVCAYVLRQLAVGWDWPLPVAAAVTLVVVAPGLGLLLDRAVFRPLAVLGGEPARTLVASIGVFVLLVGGAALVWGTGARADAPVLLSGDPWAQLAAVVVLAALVGAVTRWTRFGRELRAVVDNRPLAALGGTDTDRVAAAGWAFGSFTAGLTGVLLAPYVRLDPYGLPLLVVEVIAVAVLARMRSLPVAVVAALAIGVAQAQLTRVHPPSGWAEPLVQAIGANLFVVALLIAALTVPVPDTRDALPRSPAPAVRAAPPVAWLVAGVLFLLPFGFAGSDLHTSVQVPALAVILLSLVVVTGRGGQISLGQAAYAGLGALFTALLAAGRFPGLPAVPELPALAVAVVLVAPLGLLLGWPAIGRRGLALALTTLAFGVAVSRFVFAQPYATSGLGLTRPAGFHSDRVYYALELALLAAALLAVAALRRGRTGRALAAMRDHETGASAAGVPVPALKLLTFVTGAALAALGGGMLGMGLRAFDPAAYDPVRALLWFAAVVVLGADSLLGACAAAALLVGVDAGVGGGAAAALIGVLAVLLGHRPLTARAPARVATTEAAPEATVTPATGAPPPAPVAAHVVGPSPGPPLPGLGKAPRGGPAAVLRRPPPAPAPRHRPVGGTASPHTPLAAHALRLTYGDTYTALDGVGLTVEPGRVTALVGANGAGKSTLFHCLCGTLRPDSGRVELNGVDITRTPPHTRTRLGIARTFQELAVFPSLTVEENVALGAEQGHVRHDPTAVEAVLRLLDLAGPVRHRPAAALPTGTLRRVELGRALAGRPHTLLLDEPAAGLDTAEAERLARVMAALAADGMAVLVVEHDLDLVADIAHTVHTMTAGRIAP
ncbi:ABC transporter permease [Streptomyces agglomeratus]|uniref:ABC transporter permease subunit n=1 Tax=Streptomyces agglomeratus TaxID=285458 RepID=UPI000854EB9B|nr:ATP-binding cassette domain-containing protein [Streptomyces agglomeratus]OEJ38342.1 ABC transporter permease [Streptomyces agglomeratus]OEJ47274.1 ABC transporter permease [Streptomyces agglomeratus]OEJ50870.1 ABC transporter permease [Streptomyces agglomeratus]OEJ58233.1 ABC transporter permease [Streptomyces agglomeratus]